MLQIKNTLGGGGKGLYAWKRRKKKTIYDNGTQYEPLSIFQYISDSSNPPTGSTTFGSDSIVCACSGGGIVQGAVTDNPIDFAGYSKISIECEISTNNAVLGIVGVSSDKITPSGLKTLRVNSTDGTVRTEISYDIPSDVNNKYIVFGAQSGWKFSTDNTVKVYRVWLEASEEYVIDNNPDKYPDGAVHTDGYYYEKVSEGITPEMFGATKKEEQTFTVSSSVSEKTITHSLGEIPKLVLCFPSEDTCSESVGPFGTLILAMMRKYQGSNFTSYPAHGVYAGIYSPSDLSSAKGKFSGILNDDMFPSISQVKLFTAANFISGNTYKVILLA